MVQRDVEALDDLTEFVEEGILGRSFYRAFKLARPEPKADVFTLDALILIHDVIRRTAPGVHDVDCITLGLRKKKKRVIEITSFVLFDDVGNKK